MKKEQVKVMKPIPVKDRPFLKEASGKPRQHGIATLNQLQEKAKLLVRSYQYGGYNGL